MVREFHLTDFASDHFLCCVQDELFQNFGAFILRWCHFSRFHVAPVPSQVHLCCELSHCELVQLATVKHCLVWHCMSWDTHDDIVNDSLMTKLVIG